MRNRKRMIGLGVVLLVGGIWWVRRAPAAHAEASETVRQGVELTVYSQDFGMVSEVRPIHMTQGSNRLHLWEVSKQLDPQSVLLGWQNNAPNGAQLIANAYDLGVSDGNALLKRYLGKEVEIVRYGENGHEAERKQGTLMVEGNGDVVLQSENKFYVHPQGTIVAPIDGNIVTIPQLSVQADSPAAQNANLAITYLTRGLSWSADYVATLSAQNSTLNLECWATVTNRTGVDYPHAKVSLIAGTPNRAVQPDSVHGWQDKEMQTHLPASRASSFGGAARGDVGRSVGAPEAAGDFYAYPITSPTTVVQEQMNRLLMLSSARVSVVRDYSAIAPALSAWEGYYDVGWGTPNRPRRGTVQVAITFFNKEKDGLGQPLPRGALRLYEPDRSGTMRYAGAAQIENTPKDQRVDLTLASAFDLFTEWKLVSQKRLNRRTVRKQVEIVLHNEKRAATDLRIVQGFGETWSVAGESHKHVKLDANRAQWTVNVPAGGQVTLTYTVDLFR